MYRFWGWYIEMLQRFHGIAHLVIGGKFTDFTIDARHGSEYSEVLRGTVQNLIIPKWGGRAFVVYSYELYGGDYRYFMRFNTKTVYYLSTIKSVEYE